MAIQNFVEGGFYGKLGAMVGQRWRNIRIVRAYTVPSNPRTPAQQANRGLFREAVENSQVAMMLNQGSPIFNTENNTSWGNRMASARACQAAGKTGFNLLPVLPKNFVPSFIANKIQLVSTVDGVSATFELEGALPNENRNISIIYATKANINDEYKTTIATAIFMGASDNTFIINDPNPEHFNNMSKFLIVSNDDNGTTKQTLYMPEIFLSSHEPIIRAFNTTVSGVLRSESTFRIITEEPYIEATTAISGVQIRVVSNGVWVSENITSASLVNENGYFAIEFLQPETIGAKIWAFPVGSTIFIGSVSAVNADYILTASDVTENAVSTDLTRDFYAEIDNFVWEGEYFNIILKQGFIASGASFSAPDLIIENQSFFEENTLQSSYLNFTEKNNKLCLICENPEMPVWVGIQGSAIKATFASVITNGVTYSVNNLNLTYTYSDGSAYYYLCGSPSANQSISQRMPIYIDLGEQFDAIYSVLTSEQIIDRLSIDSIQNTVQYFDDVGNETDVIDGVTVAGYVNNKLVLSMPAGANSSFIGNQVIVTYEVLLTDTVLNQRIEIISGELETSYIWTA